MNIALPRILVIELVIIATGLILYFAGSLIAELASVALILALSILVTYALLPAVDFLSKFRFIPRALAVLLVYVALIGVVVGIVATVSKPLAHQVEDLADQYPTYVDKAKAEVPKLQEKLDAKGVNIKLEDQVNQLSDNLKNGAGTAVSKTGDIIASIFGTVSTFFLVLFVSAYFLVGGRGMVDSVVKFAPKRRQRMIKRLGKDYDRVLGSYVRGQLLISFFIFVVVAIFCTAVGLPYSIILGLVAGIMSIIPTVGTIIAMVVPAFVALFVNPVLVPIFIVFFLVLNEFTDKILYPRIVGKAVELHALVVFFGFLIGVQVAGIAGALLATPLIALAKVTAVSLSKSSGYVR
jgi:predicted PurR-regulated permease PerM